MVTYALQKLCPYLWGAQFIVYTDHKPQTYFIQSGGKKIYMCSNGLGSSQNCLYEIEYQKRKNNTIVEMLYAPSIAIVSPKWASMTQREKRGKSVKTSRMYRKRLIAQNTYSSMQSYSLILLFVGVHPHPRILLLLTAKQKTGNNAQSTQRYWTSLVVQRSGMLKPFMCGLARYTT